MYINDIPDDFNSNPKLSADNTSPFSIVHDATRTFQQMNLTMTYPNNGSPSYLHNVIPKDNIIHSTRGSNNIYALSTTFSKAASFRHLLWNGIDLI